MKKIEENRDLEQTLIKKINQVIISEKLINNNDRILIGVSGGPDSMCLLDVLKKLQSVLEKQNIKYEIGVANLNHMIRSEAIEEKKYIQRECEKRKITFFYKEVDVPNVSKELKLSEETCGRQVRYEFFNEIMNNYNYNKLAVAHNLNDNVETILLNFMRGTGLKGLIGMEYSYKNIIRPLLSIEKKDILEYNVECHLNPCFDKTNQDARYTRNNIRLNLIPLLEKEYNSNIVSNIIRMKEIIAGDNDFLDEYTQDIVSNMIIEKKKDLDKNSILFNFSTFSNLHIAIKKRVIRNIIELKVGNLDGVENIHINDILELLGKNIKGKKFILGNKFTLEIVKKNVALIK